VLIHGWDLAVASGQDTMRLSGRAQHPPPVAVPLLGERLADGLPPVHVI